MSANIELSIEETNKLRAQIGLPLIPIPDGKRSEEREPTQGPNYKDRLRRSLGLRPSISEHLPEQVNDQSGKAKEAEDPAFDPRTKYSYLEDDADSWLDSVGVNPPVRKSDDIRSTKDNLQRSDHNTIAVKHKSTSLASLEEGAIFTLVDANLLHDDSGDEYVNEKLALEEKQAADQKNRREAELQELGNRRVLDVEPNDAESDEEQKTHIVQDSIIRLSNDMPVAETSNSNDKMSVADLFEDLADPVRKVSVKRIRSKKQKSQTKKRRKETDDELTETQMYTSQLEAAPDDDMNIESILGTARKQTLKRKKLLSAEEIAKEVKLHDRLDFVASFGSGVVYDETRDFADMVGALDQSRASRKTDSSSSIASGENLGFDLKELQQTKLETQQAMPEVNAGMEERVNLGAGSSSDHEPQSNSGPDLSSVSSTLKYLRSNDYLQNETKKNKAELQQQKRAELARIQIGIEERLAREELANDVHYKKSTREEQEKILDRILDERLIAKGIVENTGSGHNYSSYATESSPLETYSPQVKIQYTDNQGNKLNKKQAWKELSHKYHGSAPKHKKRLANANTVTERVLK